MEWSDEAVILSVRQHGETSAIVETFTREHGRSLGLVRGGRSRQMRPVLQTGNHVEITWRARLAEHLGTMAVEIRQGYAGGVIDDRMCLAGLGSLCGLCRLMAERDPHPGLFEVMLFVLRYMDDGDIWPVLLVRWELALLEELGFGIDLSRCAATGVTRDLSYVSPRTGRAVSTPAAEPYKDKLLRLPAFLRQEGEQAREANSSDIVAGFALTGHFLMTHVIEPRGLKMPGERARLIRYIAARS